jgi:adenylate kinase family enzyme
VPRESSSAADSPSTVAQMRRVAVIGCGGAGKTTLANKLSHRLGIPVVHIDSHYWQLANGERVESTPEQWQARHRELISQDDWVIEGMKFGVLDERLARADTVIYLDTPTAACLTGIIRRCLRHHGQDRPELGVYVRINYAFLRWVWTFRRRQRPMLLSKLANFEGEAVILHRRRDVRRYLERIDAERNRLYDHQLSLGLETEVS